MVSFHELRFDRDGFLPVVIQNLTTKQVLMVGTVHREALRRTFFTGQVTFWSRSQGKIWLKGETSGHFLKLVDALVNCEYNSLLIWVEPIGPTCHTGAISCYETPEGDPRTLVPLPEELLPPVLPVFTDAPSLRIVIPDGSLQPKVCDWFTRAGLPITVHNTRTKQATVPETWIREVVLQKPQEIPFLVNGEEGGFDLGITGEDWLADSGVELKILHTFPVGRAGSQPVKIVLAVPEASPVQQPGDLPQNSVVATEYVELTQRYFQKLHRSDIRVRRSAGNTEHKVLYGATAIVDVTETGRSLVENRLRVIDTLMESSVAIVTPARLYETCPQKRAQIDLLVRLLAGAARADQFIWLVANVPEEKKATATAILGGLQAATYAPLTKDGWCSLAATVPAAQEITIISQLGELGVYDIVVQRRIDNLLFPHAA